MTRSARFLVLLPCLCLQRGGACAGEANIPPEGFVALFNGRDFAGWVGADHAGRPERPNAVNPRRSGRPVLRHLPKGNSQAGAPQQIGKNLFLN